MSVPTYHGKTYVGYLDITGFKQMMGNRKQLKSVMDKFYRTMYGAIHEANSTTAVTKMNVIAISDCAILFLNKGRKRDVDEILGLKKMLQVIRYVNRQFIIHDFPFMTTCSISYGDFNYEDKKDWRHIRKNCMNGTAYVESFLDSRLEKPKLKPSQCRLLKRGLSTVSIQLLETNLNRNNDFRMLHSVRDYYYFYWMLEDVRSIRKFRKAYKRTFDHMYDELKELLRNPEFRTSTLANGINQQ